MSKIEINFKKVKSIGQDFSSVSRRVSNGAASVSMVRSQLDSKIKSRKNIGSDLSTIATSLSEVSRKIDRIEKVVVKSAELYEQAEKKIVKNAEKFERWKVPKWVDWTQKGLEFSARSLKGLANIHFDNGLRLNIAYKDGQFIINLENKITPGNSHSYNTVRELFEGNFKKVDKVFHRIDLEELLKNGMPLYMIGNIFKGEKLLQKNNRTHEIFEKDKVKKSFKSKLNDFWKGGKKALKRFPKSLLNETLDTVKQFDPREWKNATKLDKLGKSAGIFGVGIDFANAWSAAKDAAPGKGRNTFLVEFGVDTAIGIGSAATGAAIGSVIVPPLGTVIGAGIGIGIDCITDAKWFNNGQSSIKDAVKGGAMKAINKVESGIKDIKKGASKAVSKAADFIGSGLKGLKGRFAW